MLAVMVQGQAPRACLLQASQARTRARSDRQTAAMGSPQVMNPTVGQVHAASSARFVGMWVLIRPLPLLSPEIEAFSDRLRLKGVAWQWRPCLQDLNAWSGSLMVIHTPRCICAQYCLLYITGPG